MLVSFIVAVAENGVIGKDNKLLWRLPEDVKYFKTKTLGHVIVTGRKNYESIPEKFRPLPERTNIIITRQKDYKAPGAVVVDSIESALDKARSLGEKECFVIGGGEIFKQMLDQADRLYVTHVHASYEGDAFFPPLEPGKWQKTFEKFYPADEKHAHDFTIIEYDRVK